MDRKINKYYRTIKVNDGNGGKRDHVLFDYQAIWEDEAPIFLIISERGAKGKSTQAKKLARDIYTNHSLKTMWMMNSVKLIDKEKKSHLTKPISLLPESFSGLEMVNGDVVLADREDKSSWYCKFAALSTAETEKGSRDDYGLLIYDEFNVGLDKIRNLQTDLLSSLIGTLSDPVNTSDDNFKKFIIHGNYKSLANQFLIDMGVLSITEEVTDVVVDGVLLMRILSPIMTDEDKQVVIDNNKNNWKFLLQKRLGKADHVYFNASLQDRINFVNQWMTSIESSMSYIMKFNSMYFKASIKSVDMEDENGVKSKNNVFYFEALEEHEIPEDAQIYAMNQRSVIEGVQWNQNLKANFLKYLAAERVYFHSVYIRETVIEAITK